MTYTVGAVAVEPLTLKEVRMHGRIIYDITEHDLLQTLIIAAREYCENLTRSAIPPRTVTVEYERGGVYELPLLPVSKIISCSTDYKRRNNIITLPEAATVVYEAGYDSIPASIKQAMLLLVTYWYDNREAAATEQLRAIPMAVDNLLRPYRQKWL